MTVGIYAIYSKTDGACLYVGQSKEIEVRFRQHLTKLKNRRTQALACFVEWYHAHGAREEFLQLVVLEECADDDLIKNELEAFWFDELKPRFYGKAPSLSETWSHSAATRSKISASNARGATTYSKTCAFCSAGFQSVKRTAKFCSTSCRSHAGNGAFTSKSSLPSRERLVELYVDRKLTLAEVGQELGCSLVTAANLLARFEIPRRSKGNRK